MVASLRVPIRWRLSLLTMAVVGPVIAASGFVSNRSWAGHVRHELDETVAEEAREFAFAAATLSSEEELTDFAEDYFWTHRHEDPERVFLLLLTDGTRLSLHMPEGGNLFPAGLPAPSPGVIAVESRRSVDDVRYRMASTALRMEGQEAGSFFVAEPTGPVDALISDRIRNAVLVSLLALIAAGAGSYFIAGLSLAPVRTVTSTAESISQHDLGQRLSYVGADDEVGRLAGAFDAMIERLDAAFAEQRRLLAELSHQLRTPLTIVRGHLELLGRHPDQPREEATESIGAAIDELDRMNRLVGGLLLLSRTAAADFLRSSPLQLKGLLEQIMVKAAGLAPRQWQVGELPDCTVDADGDQLTDAFLNLLENAAEHTNEGDEIGIRGRVDGEWAEVEVWDSGEGIEPDDLPHVFERFYRARSSPERRPQGTGLGLTIVEAIVEAHGGEIRAESVAGAGTSVVVRLPVKR